MALKEVGENGSVRDVLTLEHRSDFDRDWLALTPAQRVAIEQEINTRLDELLANPSPNWGSVTNTSIEGGKQNALTGAKGDWTGTVFQPIYNHFADEKLAGMFFGNLWKMAIIDRPERWVGVRLDPTFPQRGITLQGKTYFPE